MPTSKETQEFIDDIDDGPVKAELVTLYCKLDAIEAGGRGDDLGAEEFCRAFDRAFEGTTFQISRQRQSINRLLDERRQNLSEIARMRSEILVWKEMYEGRKPGKSEGPE